MIKLSSPQASVIRTTGLPWLMSLCLTKLLSMSQPGLLSFRGSTALGLTCVIWGRVPLLTKHWLTVILSSMPQRSLHKVAYKTVPVSIRRSNEKARKRHQQNGSQRPFPVSHVIFHHFCYVLYSQRLLLSPIHNQIEKTTQNMFSGTPGNTSAVCMP